MTIVPEEKRVPGTPGKPFGGKGTGRRTYRVATPEGAAKYGQPIGTIITLDSSGKVVGKPASAPKPATTSGTNRPAAATSADAAPAASTSQTKPRTADGVTLTPEQAREKYGEDDTIRGTAGPAAPKKRTPKEARLEEVRTTLRTNADLIEAGPDITRKDAIVANLREAAEDPDLIVGPPGTTLIGRKRDKTYSVMDMGTGMVLGPATTGLKKADVLPFLTRLSAALANGDDDAGPFAGGIDTGSKIKTWKRGGLPVVDVLAISRADFDTSKGYTGTSAQEYVAGMAERDAGRKAARERDERMAADGFARQKSTSDIPNGADAVYVDSDGTEHRGRLVGNGVYYDASYRRQTSYRLLQEDGTVQEYKPSGGYGASVSYARTRTDPLPGWVDAGDGVYLEMLSGAQYGKADDGSAVVYADGRQVGYVGPSKDEPGRFDGRRMDFYERPKEERGTADTPSFDTAQEAARALAGRSASASTAEPDEDADEAPERTEEDDRREQAEALRATAGPGDEVLTAEEFAQRNRERSVQGQRIRVVGSRRGDAPPLEGTVTTFASQPSNDLPPEPGEITRLTLSTVDEDGEPNLRFPRLMPGDVVVLLADRPAETDEPEEFADALNPRPATVPSGVEDDDPGGAARANVNIANRESQDAIEANTGESHRRAMVAHNRANAYPGVLDRDLHYQWAQYHSERWRILTRTPAKMRAYERAAERAREATEAAQPGDDNAARLAQNAHNDALIAAEKAGLYRAMEEHRTAGRDARRAGRPAATPEPVEAPAVDAPETGPVINGERLDALDRMKGRFRYQTGEARAALFWAETYQQNMAVRRAMSNIRAGRDPLDGVPGMEEQEQRVLGAVSRYSEQDWGIITASPFYASRTLSDPDPFKGMTPTLEETGYDDDAYRRDAVFTARTMLARLENAPESEVPLYRGITMERPTDLSVGMVIDAEQASWSTDEQVAVTYAKLPSNNRFRFGDGRVVFVLPPGTPAASLADETPENFDKGMHERLVPGGYRITNIRRTTQFGGDAAPDMPEEFIVYRAEVESTWQPTSAPPSSESRTPSIDPPESSTPTDDASTASPTDPEPETDEQRISREGAARQAALETAQVTSAPSRRGTGDRAVVVLPDGREIVGDLRKPWVVLTARRARKTDGTYYSASFHGTERSAQREAEGSGGGYAPGAVQYRIVQAPSSDAPTPAPRETPTPEPVEALEQPDASGVTGTMRETPNGSLRYSITAPDGTTITFASEANVYSHAIIARSPSSGKWGLVSRHREERTAQDAFSTAQARRRSQTPVLVPLTRADEPVEPVAPPTIVDRESLAETVRNLLDRDDAETPDVPETPDRPPVADEPVLPSEAPESGDVEYVLEDATYADLEAGDRIMDDGREAVVLENAFADDGGAEVDVRYLNDERNTIFAPRSMYVQRIRAEEAATLPEQVYTPPPIPRGAAKGRVALTTTQRRVINEMALDSDMAQPEIVRLAAARLRAKGPLTPDEHRAMSAAMRARSQDESLDARRRALLQRVTQRFGYAADSAEVSTAVRGTGRRRPPQARVARQVAVGDGVRIPATQGYEEIQGRVTAVRKDGTMRVLTIRTEDGRTTERTLLGGTYLEVSPGFGAEEINDRPPVGDLQPGDRVDMGDGVPRTVIAVEPIGDGSLVNLRVTDPDTGEESAPFGRDVPVSRLYGPESAPPPEVEVGPRETTPAGIVVGEVVVDRYSDTGKPFTYRIATVEPTMGGTKYRVTGYIPDPEGMRQFDKQFEQVFDATEMVTVLPDPGEDKPLPDPVLPKPEPDVDVADLEVGDRITVRNPATGFSAVKMISSITRTDDSTDVRFAGDYGRGHSFEKGEKVERIERLGEDWVREQERQAAMTKMTYEVAEGLRETQREAVKAVQRIIERQRLAGIVADANAGTDTGGRRIDNLLRASRQQVEVEMTRLVNTNASLIRARENAAKSLLGDEFGADSMAEQIRKVQVAAAMRTAARMFEGFDKAGTLTDDRINRMLAAMRDDNEGGVVRDYDTEVGILVRNAPRFAGAAPITAASTALPSTDDLKGRIAAMKASLPAIFGSVYVERKTYGEFTLESLERGETPPLVAQVAGKRDVAADGGPGEQTMSHLETVKRAGTLLQEQIEARYDRILYGSNADEIRRLTVQRDAIAQEIATERDRIRELIVREENVGVASVLALRTELRSLRDIGRSARTPAQTARYDLLTDLDHRAAFGTSKHPESRFAEMNPRLQAANDALEAASRGKNDGIAMSEAEIQDLVSADLDAGQAVTQAEWAADDRFFQEFPVVTADGITVTSRATLDNLAENALLRRDFPANRMLQAAQFALDAYRGKDAAVKKAVKAREKTTAARKEATKRKADTGIAQRTARARAAREVLAEVRDLGAKGDARFNIDTSERSELSKGVRWAEQFYPTDWLEAQKGVRMEVVVDPIRKTKRGYSGGRGRYEQYRTAGGVTARRVLRLGKKGETVLGSGEFGQNALHELGHHMESLIPGLARAEDAFLWSRTTDADTEVGSRTRVGPKNKKTSLGYSDVTETAREDDFLQQYTGKEYDGTFFEVFTMGMESLFGGSKAITSLPGDIATPRHDADFEAFMLGTLALL